MAKPENGRKLSTISSELPTLNTIFHQFNEESAKKGIPGLTILFTGFGPLPAATQSSSPSWEAVSKLPFCSIDSLLPSNVAASTPVKLIGYEIPRVYKFIGEIVPRLWTMHKPDLVIHVGQGPSKSNYFRVEEGAPNLGYKEKDNEGQLPPEGQVVAKGQRNLKSGFDMRKVVKGYNERKNVVRLDLFGDAGANLNGFIYYKSLSLDRNKVAFIQLPHFQQGYGAMATGICFCVAELLRQLQNKSVLAACGPPLPPPPPQASSQFSQEKAKAEVTKEFPGKKVTIVHVREVREIETVEVHTEPKPKPPPQSK